MKTSRYLITSVLIAGLAVGGVDISSFAQINPGGLIGGVTGGVIGASIGGRGAGAVAGGIGGALIGGYIGNEIGRSMSYHQRYHAAYHARSAYHTAFHSDKTTYWKSGHLSGKVIPGTKFTTSKGVMCQNYTHMIYFDGKLSETRKGYACQTSKGNWTVRK